MTKTYITVQGDMWDMIAYKTYGKEGYLHYLLEANEQYKDVAVFPQGITLVVPDVPDVTATTLPPWRK